MAPANGATTVDRSTQQDSPRTSGGLPTGESTRIVEARTAPRLPAAEVPSIKSVRLRPFGADATLVNISATGILVECATRLRLGTAVTVVFEGTFSPATVEGRVARSTVMSVSQNGVLRYHVGVVFANPIPLPLDVAPTAVPSSPEVATAPQAPSVRQAPSGPINRW
jgi:hypothetical protein